MNLAAILASLNIALEGIVSSAGYALELIAVKETTKTFFGFINNWLARYPGTPRKEAANQYRLAKYWQHPDEVLSKLDPNVMIPRALARIGTKRPTNMPLTAQYAYQAKVVFTDLETGQQSIRHPWIYTNVQESVSGVDTRTRHWIDFALQEGSPLIPEDKSIEEFGIEISVVNFVRYE